MKKKRLLSLVMCFVVLSGVFATFGQSGVSLVPTATTAQAKTLKASGRVKSLTVVQGLSQTVYTIGSSLKTTGLKLRATYANGATKTVRAKSCKITGFSSKTTGTKTVKFKFVNRSVKLKVKVIKPLVAPVIKSVSNNGSSITLKWGKVANATGYYISRKTTSATTPKYSRIATIKKGTTVTYKDTSVELFSTYTYKVRAYVGSIKGEISKPSQEISYIVKPKLHRVTNGKGNVMVKWQWISSVDGYNVYRKTAEETNYTKIAKVTDPDTTFYKDTTVKSGTTYKYTVKAYKGSKESSCDEEGLEITYSQLTKTKIFGVDISKWQGDFNFNKAMSEGMEFAIIKGGGGYYRQTTGNYKYHYVDEKFEQNYKELKERHLPVGVYWFTGAVNVAEAKAEAEYCYNNILKGKQFELPIYIDIEMDYIFETGRTNEIAQTWCEYLENKGYYTGIYGSLNFFKDYMNAPKLNAYAHWVACWQKSCSYSDYDSFGMWQFGGSRNQIRTNQVAGQTCDQDYMFINYPEIIQNAHLNGF